MRARSFFYVCAGLFLLALSWHLGARSARAQAGGSVVGLGAGSGGVYAVTSSGDFYEYCVTCSPGHWSPRANVFTGAPTPVKPETLGGLKSRYR